MTDQPPQPEAPERIWIDLHDPLKAKLMALKTIDTEIEYVRADLAAERPAGHVLITETDNATYDRLVDILLEEDHEPALSLKDADDVLRDIIAERNQLRSMVAERPADEDASNVTPEQIVYNVAQRDPGFRQHIIEQLTALGEKQDRGPLRKIGPADEELRSKAKVALNNAKACEDGILLSADDFTALSDFVRQQAVSRPADERLAAAFHRGVDAAKEAIRSEEGTTQELMFWRASFINAIARKCGYGRPADADERLQAIRERHAKRFDLATELLREVLNRDIDYLLSLLDRQQIDIARLTAEWCKCSHAKTSHSFFEDHDECDECDSEDGCCEWQPVSISDRQQVQERP